MRKKLGKGTKEFEMFQEYWAIVQNYYIIEDKEDYWEKFTNELDAFKARYGKFGHSLAMSFFYEQERKYFEKFKKSGDGCGNKEKLQ